MEMAIAGLLIVSTLQAETWKERATMYGQRLKEQASRYGQQTKEFLSRHKKELIGGAAVVGGLALAGAAGAGISTARAKLQERFADVVVALEDKGSQILFVEEGRIEVPTQAGIYVMKKVKFPNQVVAKKYRLSPHSVEVIYKAIDSILQDKELSFDFEGGEEFDF